MPETFRISKVMKLIHKLRDLKSLEKKHTLMLSQYLQKPDEKGILSKSPNTLDEIYQLLDTLNRSSHENQGISFEHKTFLFLHETLFHLGSTQMIDRIIKEIGDHFDLDIPERSKNNSVLKDYTLETVDTKDYSMMPKKFYVIVGGMGSSFNPSTHEKCKNLALSVLLKFIDPKQIKEVEDGLIFQAPIQVVPEINRSFIHENIGIYGIVPIKDQEK